MNQSRSSAASPLWVLAFLILAAAGLVSFYMRSFRQPTAPRNANALIGLALSQVDVSGLLRIDGLPETALSDPARIIAQLSASAAPSLSVNPVAPSAATGGGMAFRDERSEALRDAITRRLKRGGVAFVQMPEPTDDGYYPPLDPKDDRRAILRVTTRPVGASICYHLDFSVEQPVYPEPGGNSTIRARTWHSDTLGAAPPDQVMAAIQRDAWRLADDFIEYYQVANGKKASPAPVPVNR